MFYLTPQEKTVILSVCIVIFAGTLIHIGQQKELRVFNWLHTAQKKALIIAIDINRASAEELLRVPGVGPKTAQFILSYRPFINIEELRKARGMSPQRYERIIKYFKI